MVLSTMVVGLVFSVVLPLTFGEPVTINGVTCDHTDVIAFDGCAEGAPHFDPEGQVCHNDGMMDAMFCSYEYAAVSGDPVKNCARCLFEGEEVPEYIGYESGSGFQSGSGMPDGPDDDEVAPEDDGFGDPEEETPLEDPEDETPDEPEEEQGVPEKDDELRNSDDSESEDLWESDDRWEESEDRPEYEGEMIALGDRNCPPEIVIAAAGCSRGHDEEGSVCGNDGLEDEMICSFEFADKPENDSGKACVRCPNDAEIQAILRELKEASAASDVIVPLLSVVLTIIVMVI